MSNRELAHSPHTKPRNKPRAVNAERYHANDPNNHLLTILRFALLERMAELQPTMKSDLEHADIPETAWATRYNLRWCGAPATWAVKSAEDTRRCWQSCPYRGFVFSWGHAAARNNVSFAALVATYDPLEESHHLARRRILDAIEHSLDIQMAEAEAKSGGSEVPEMRNPQHLDWLARLLCGKTRAEITETAGHPKQGQIEYETVRKAIVNLARFLQVDTPGCK